MNSSGSILFGAYAGNSGNPEALWIQGDGAPALIASSGQTAAGIGNPNIRYSTFSSPALSDSGAFALVAKLGGSAVDSSNDSALYRRGPSGLQLLARLGSPLPGIGGPPVIAIPTFTSVNSSGDIAFYTALGVNTQAVVRSTPAGLSIVAKTGDPAPGFGDGVTYKFVSPQMNDAGQILISGAVAGPGITATNAAAAWIAEPDGSVNLLIREGQQLTFNGVTKTVKSFSIDMQEQLDDMNGFNAAGQVAMQLQFTDQSFAIVVTQVPEPSTAILAAIPYVAHRRRRVIKP